MDTDDPIKSVHVVSTGSGEQHAEHRYGSRMPSLWWILTSRSWIEIPINVYVLEHRDGLVLFDAGMDARIGSDPNYVSNAVVRFFQRKLFRLHIGPDDTLTSKLSGLGYAAADVGKVIIFHLHFDHIGCIKEVPQADLLVNADEWRQLSGPHPERDFIFREHIELPEARWQQIDLTASGDPLLAPFGGSHDVMGDGSLTLLPTPGHTSGSMSLLVRTGNLPPLLLVGDLTYETGMLMNDRVPGTGDKKQLRASFARVRALKEKLPNLVILPCHDPAASEALAH
ncbi:MAG: hypothetical protein CMM10_09345 [Rhodospirillaceae bacterium]|nr:hypothetical protein [Rhodospirillaceae bacterium]|tara:strand:+ start:264 stop:1112 length:849 start_codon:yes stop_codon:yes gene_type:complete